MDYVTVNKLLNLYDERNSEYIILEKWFIYKDDEDTRLENEFVYNGDRWNIPMEYLFRPVRDFRIEEGSLCIAFYE